MKNYFLIVAILCVFSSTVHAADPRDELEQLTAQLQSNPSDTALRERIIKLARTIRPSPAIPAEAERFDGRGEYAFKSAKSEADYLTAAQEFEKATNTAPWVGSYYFNTGTAYEKAQRPKEAKQNFELYLLASPDARDVREVKRRIAGLEFAIEKENAPEQRAAREQESPEVQAARKREQQEAMIQSLDGAMFGHEFTDAAGTVTARFAVEVRGKQAIWTAFDVSNRNTDTMNCVLDGRGCVLRGEPWKVALEISADGQQASVFAYGPSGDLGQTIVHQRHR